MWQETESEENKSPLSLFNSVVLKYRYLIEPEQSKEIISMSSMGPSIMHCQCGRVCQETVILKLFIQNSERRWHRRMLSSPPTDTARLKTHSENDQKSSRRYMNVTLKRTGEVETWMGIKSHQQKGQHRHGGPPCRVGIRPHIGPLCPGNLYWVDEPL